MNTNNKLFVAVVLVLSIAMPLRSYAMQEGWPNVALELREMIRGLTPDLQKALNFLARRPLHTFFKAHSGAVAVADGIIVTGLSDATARVLDRKNYKELARLQGNDSLFQSIAVADGIIVAGLSDKTAKVWDRKNYKEITTLKGHTDRITSVAVADDIIVTGSWDNTAKVWDRNNYKEIITLKGHTSAVYSVAVADGIIVTGSGDNTAKVWDRNN